MKEFTSNGNTNVWKPIGITLISVLLSFNIFMLTGLKKDVHKIDDKIFHHLTNDEMHVLRDTVTTKAEFEMHRKFANSLYTNVCEMIDKLEINLKNEMKYYMGSKK